MKELKTHYLCSDCGKEFKYFDMEKEDFECIYCESKNIKKLKSPKEKIKFVHINAICNDLCYTEFMDKDKTILKELDGNPPDFLGDGDCIDLTIDIQNGKILNWEQPKKL